MHRYIVLAVSIGFATVGCGGPTTRADAGTGGGSATGGGTGASCMSAPDFLVTDIDGKPGFDPGSTQSVTSNYATFVKTDATTMKTHAMSNELYTAAPLANVTIPAKTYQECDLCFIISYGCNSMGQKCQGEYLAQSGKVTVNQATKDPDAGTYAFTLQGVVTPSGTSTPTRPSPTVFA